MVRLLKVDTKINMKIEFSTKRKLIFGLLKKTAELAVHVARTTFPILNIRKKKH